MITILKNISFTFVMTVLDESQNFISGLTVHYTIRKSVDDSLLISGTMAEVNSTYAVSYSFTNVGKYYITYFLPTGYAEIFETIDIIDSIDPTRPAQEAMFKTVFGLSPEKYKICNPTYDGNANILTATVKTYASASDCTNDINVVDTYNIIINYIITSKLTACKVTKIS